MICESSKLVSSAIYTCNREYIWTQIVNTTDYSSVTSCWTVHCTSISNSMHGNSLPMYSLRVFNIMLVNIFRYWKNSHVIEITLFGIYQFVSIIPCVKGCKILKFKVVSKWSHNVPNDHDLLNIVLRTEIYSSNKPMSV